MLLSDPLPLGERRSGTRIAKDAIQGPAPFYSPQSTHAFRSAFAAGRRERFRSSFRSRKERTLSELLSSSEQLSFSAGNESCNRKLIHPREQRPSGARLSRPSSKLPGELNSPAGGRGCVDERPLKRRRHLERVLCAPTYRCVVFRARACLPSIYLLPPADAYPASPANSVSGFTVYPISSHFVSSSSRICALVDDVLCSRTMAPGWIRPRSFSNASSCVG